MTARHQVPQNTAPCRSRYRHTRELVDQGNIWLRHAKMRVSLSEERVAKKYAQLSIDVTTALVDAGGVVDVTARVRRFVTRAFRVRRRRHFVASWMPGGVLDAVGGGSGRTADLRVFLSRENVSIGDRIVLIATVEEALAQAAEPAHREAKGEEADEGWATLYDGAALFVLHVLDRADPLTRDRLSGLPPRATPRKLSIPRSGISGRSSAMRSSSSSSSRRSGVQRAFRHSADTSPAKTLT